MNNDTESNIKHNPEINIYITIKSVGFAALVGLSGYTLYPSSSHSEEVSGLDSAYILALRRDVDELKISMRVFTAEMAKQNRNIIETNVTEK